MSELRAYRIKGLTLGDFHDVYLKSEADKVIAELKKKLDLYKRGFAEDDKINAYLYAELRHQKYKRCLAMSKWCEVESWQCCFCKSKFYAKWRNRWLKIAEQFKEAK